MSVEVKTQIPHQALIPMPKSTSAHVIRRRLVEILPNENTNFKYSQNDRIVFNISSQNEMLDGLNSYLKFDLTCTYNGASSTLIALSEGGAHCLFKSVELRTQSGTLLERIDRYNRWYAMMSNLTHNPCHIENVEGSCGDSIEGDNKINLPYEKNGYDATYDVAAATFTRATGVLNLGTGRAKYDFTVGDLVAIRSDNAFQTSVVGVVSAITDENTIVVRAGSTGADLVAGQITSIKVYKSGQILPMRAKSAQTADFKINMKIALGMLQYAKWIPLMLIKQGLQLVLELENPTLALQYSHKPSVATSALDYTISSPRYVANMVTPDDSLLAVYLNEFQSGGIHIPIIGYAHRRKTINTTESGDTVINHHFGVRSASAVFSFIQGQSISETDGNVAKVNDSISTFLKSKVKKYQYQSGSEQYPQKQVEWEDGSGFEAFQQAMLATNQFGSTLWDVRFHPSKWLEQNKLYNSNNNNFLNNQSVKFVMATKLARNDDNFTGLDLSINPLDLMVNFENIDDENYGQRIINTFVAHDVLVSISSSGLVVRK